MNQVDKLWIKTMLMGKRTGCHQMAERSFFIKGYQMPICARCTGVWIGYLISLSTLLFKKLPLRVDIAFLSIMLFDWGIQFLNIKASSNSRRLLTGIMGGIGWIGCFIKVILYIYKSIKL